MNKPVNVDDETILAVIDKSLASLGENPHKALWVCLEKNFNVDRTKVPENLETFQRILQRFFGQGYTFLETLFIRNLSEVTGEKLDNQSTFVDCVTRLRGNINEEPVENVVVETSRVTENFLRTGK